MTKHLPELGFDPGELTYAVGGMTTEEANRANGFDKPKQKDVLVARCGANHKHAPHNWASGAYSGHYWECDGEATR